jgi:hypothetical protein
MIPRPALDLLSSQTRASHPLAEVAQVGDEGFQRLSTAQRSAGGTISLWVVIRTEFGCAHGPLRRAQQDRRNQDADSDHAASGLR